jgi:hypothetical protein
VHWQRRDRVVVVGNCDSELDLYWNFRLLSTTRARRDERICGRRARLIGHPVKPVLESPKLQSDP